MAEPTEAFEHWCEVCGKTEVLTSEEAYRLVGHSHGRIRREAAQPRAERNRGTKRGGRPDGLGHPE